MTTGIGPYHLPDAVDTNSSETVLETTILTSKQAVDIGGGVIANAEVYNGAIPGPLLRLNAGDTAIVRLVNNLPHPTGIHWHGIELQNSADGTPVTQNAIAPAGGTYLYKFKVPRPGLYWYHPHHHHSTNRAFRGLYGMIVVTDPNEDALIASGVLPGPVDTYQVVLSDITVCKAVGSNDSATYDPALPFLASSTVQPAPTPEDLCELEPLTEEGHHAHHPFGAGDIPNTQRHGPGRTNEGQTVLTNGVNVGGRSGTPSSPGALAAGAKTLNVQAGQGIRLQLVNCSTLRYFRLRLTTSNGTQAPLVRVGGEGGLLDHAVVEGGVIAGFDTKYSTGEILLPAGSRADVVAAIPASATGALTLWTQDYQRTGFGFSIIPTVPVMHLNVAGSTTPYTIAAGTPLRAAIPGQAVEVLSGPFNTLLNPTTFTPAKPGMSNQEMRITITHGMLGIDGIHGGTGDHGSEPYNLKPHFGSARFGKTGDVLELAVTNTTNAHHPFHLHGFSVQPVSLTRSGFPTYTWPYREFRDNIDIPGGYTLTFRARLDDRELADGITPGGALGRWLFHCHIFFHAHMGMVSEFVTAAVDGSEKPTIDVVGSWAYAPVGGTATRSGTYSHPDGDPMTLSTSLGTVTDTGGGTWSWSHTGSSPSTQYVYVTATDSSGRKDQAVFRLKIGGLDDGSDGGEQDMHAAGASMIQGDYGDQGNFELVLSRPSGGLTHWYRVNDIPGNPWLGPGYFGGGYVYGASLIQSTFMTDGNGNLEVIVCERAVGEVGARLAHYYRSGPSDRHWIGPHFLPPTVNVSGSPCLIQSSYGTQGNFEVVAPISGGGLVHFYRDNDAPGYPWRETVRFGASLGQVDAVAVIQNRVNGNFELVARAGSNLYHLYRDGTTFQWHGPTATVFTEAAGIPDFIQSTYGVKGNFELVSPCHDGGLVHLWRDNDAPGIPWHETTRFGATSHHMSDHVKAVSLFQSNYGTPGHLEVAAQLDAGIAAYERNGGWNLLGDCCQGPL